MQASTVDGQAGSGQAGSGGGASVAEAATFVTFMIGGQAFGVPVLVVQDILLPDRIAPIPLSHPAVRGSINVRGKIVTVVDVRARLGLPAGESDERRMGVTVENQGELYALLVDRVGDVLAMPASRFQEKPSSLTAAWAEVATGIYRQDDGLLVTLDVQRLLTLN